MPAAREAGEQEREALRPPRVKRSKGSGGGLVYGMVAFVALGGLLFGLDQGNWGGAITKKEFVEGFCGTEQACFQPAHLPVAYAQFLALGSALLQAGAALGSMIMAPWLAEHGGRRETMFAGCILTIIGVLPQMFTFVRILFLSARVFAGLGVGMVTYVLPMLISEIAPPDVRGALGSSMQFMVSFAIFLASVLNAQGWFGHTLSFSLPLYPAIIVVSGIFCFPDSPRHEFFKLHKQGREKEAVDKARASLVKLRGSASAAEDELAEIRTAGALEGNQGSASWSDLFKDPSMRRRVEIAVMLQLMQQFTGVNVIAGYGPSIFQASGVPVSGLTCAVIVNVFGLSGSIGMMAVIDKFGRRFLLLVGAAAMCVFQVSAGLLAFQLDKKDKKQDVGKDQDVLMGWMLVACVVLYIFFFAGCWGGVPWVYPSEIFPMEVKEKALAVSTCFQWVANFLIAYFVPLQVRFMKPAGTFLFYGACLALSFVYVYARVPETKGLKLEDMGTLFGDEGEEDSTSGSSSERSSE